MYGTFQMAAPWASLPKIVGPSDKLGALQSVKGVDQLVPTSLLFTALLELASFQKARSIIMAGQLSSVPLSEPTLGPASATPARGRSGGLGTPLTPAPASGTSPSGSSSSAGLPGSGAATAFRTGWLEVCRSVLESVMGNLDENVQHLILDSMEGNRLPTLYAEYTRLEELLALYSWYLTEIERLPDAEAASRVTTMENTSALRALLSAVPKGEHHMLKNDRRYNSAAPFRSMGSVVAQSHWADYRLATRRGQKTAPIMHADRAALVAEHSAGPPPQQGSVAPPAVPTAPPPPDFSSLERKVEASLKGQQQRIVDSVLSALESRNYSQREAQEGRNHSQKEGPPRGGRKRTRDQGAPPSRPRPANKRSRCRFWSSNSCWSGDKCRFLHEGAGGASPRPQQAGPPPTPQAAATARPDTALPALQAKLDEQSALLSQLLDERRAKEAEAAKASERAQVSAEIVATVEAALGRRAVGGDSSKN